MPTSRKRRYLLATSLTAGLFFPLGFGLWLAQSVWMPHAHPPSRPLPVTLAEFKASPFLPAHPTAHTARLPAPRAMPSRRAHQKPASHAISQPEPPPAKRIAVRKSAPVASTPRPPAAASAKRAKPASPAHHAPNRPAPTRPQAVKARKSFNEPESHSRHHSAARTATVRHAAPDPAAPYSHARQAPPASPAADPQIHPADLERQQAARQAARERYLQALHRRLAHLAQENYPYRARRMGQEGQVLITFVIRRDGKITNVRLSRSSGFSLLDRAAKALIAQRMNGRFRPFPPELTQARMEIAVPIRYRLR